MKKNRFSRMGVWKWLTEFQMLVLRAAPAPRNAPWKRFQKGISTSSTKPPASIAETARMFARLALRLRPNKRIERRSTKGPSEISDGLFFLRYSFSFFRTNYQPWKFICGPILAIIQSYEKADRRVEKSLGQWLASFLWMIFLFSSFLWVFKGGGNTL